MAGCQSQRMCIKKDFFKNLTLTRVLWQFLEGVSDQ